MHDNAPRARPGRPPLFPDADSAVVSARLHPTTHQQLCTIAATTGDSLSDVVRRACIVYANLDACLAWKRDVRG